MKVFIKDLICIDWPTVIDLESDNPSHFHNAFETKITTLFDKYVPLRKSIQRWQKRGIPSKI